MQRYKIEEYEAYKDSINIELFNEIVSFIFHTTNNDHIPILKELKKKVIWFKLEKDNSIQNNYGFKYIGELLERFEERIGNDIKDIRAIALSIAFTKELINGRMIIGTQLINFITKIEIMSKNDFYLKMALYIYDNVKYLDIFKQLLNEMPKKTEEIVFMFSAFADINDGLKRIGDKLEKSLGNERNMSVIKNAGIYNWLIKTLYPIIKGNRKKGIEFFKALITIPTGLLKEDSKEFNMLLNNGYNKIEIAFLNYRLIFYGSIPQTVRIGNSIVEEKIAINLCEKVLNNTETLEDELYEMVLAMLDEYEYFDIKYHGYEGLAEAIEKTINITNPKVFIKFYKRFYGRVYDFNILDPKWDIISQEFSKREYENLFNNYINSNEYNSEQLREIIRKYEELTHSSFIEFFYNSEWCKSFTYNLLVDKEIISLIESFEKFKEMNSDKKEKNALIKYVRGYISGIHTKKAFDFFDYFFKNHSPKEAEKYEFNIDNIWLENTWYEGRVIGTINIKKNFLSNTEKREMIMWLENYIFNIRPNDYINYIIAILNTEGIEDLFSNEELRKLYLAVCKTDNKILRYQGIREKYLLKSELEDLEKKEKEYEKNKEQQEIAKLENRIRKAFNSTKNKNIKNIFKFCDDYEYSSKGLPICYKIVKSYFKYNLSEIEFNKEDIIKFNELCNLFLKENLMTIYEYRNYMMKFIRGERLFYAKNTRAYRANRQTKSA